MIFFYYIPKIKAKSLEISVNGNSYIKVICSIIENNVTTQLDINFHSTENSDIPKYY